MIFGPTSVYRPGQLYGVCGPIYSFSGPIFGSSKLCDVTKGNVGYQYKYSVTSTTMCSRCHISLLDIINTS